MKMMSRAIFELHAVAEASMQEAADIESEIEVIGAEHPEIDQSSLVIRANTVEDCYTIAAVAQKVAAWLNENDFLEEGPDTAETVVMLCTEVAAVVREETQAGGVQGSRGETPTWH